MSKAEWKTVKLGDVCEMYQPKTISQDEMITDGQFPVYGANGIIGRYNSYNHDLPQLLVTCRGATCGTINISEPYSWITGNSMVVRFKPNIDVDINYLTYYLRQNEMFNTVITGAAQPQITRTNLKSLRFIYPNSLHTQRHIAATLDKANELITLRKKQLEELDALAEAVFYDLFGDPVKNEKGWEMKKLEQVCSKITDGEHATPKRVSDGIFLLSARNILNHKINLLDVDYIDDDEYNRISKRIIPKENDILISCSGSIGRVCRVPENLKFQMVRSVAILQLKDNVNPIFIEYQLCTSFIQRQINRSINQSSQANLFQGKIKLLTIFLPSYELQTRFATIIEKIEEQKAQVRQALQESEDLFQRLMQDLFHPH